MVTIEKGKYRLEINQDNSPINPRDNDNISKMVCFHRRYNLGDKHEYQQDNYNSWDELEKSIIKNEDPICIFPLYLYDHSGITISINSFNDRWDSGQVGFVFVTKEYAKEIYNKKRISKKIKDRIEEIIKNEVEEFDNFLTGNVYCIDLYNDNKLIESFGGFYGEDFWLNGMSYELPQEVITELIEELEKEFGKKP
jgi:hypothetical protein